MKSDKYLVEVRLSGYAKKFTKELIWDISKRFHVRGVTIRRPVPHLTLAGTFEETNKKKIWDVVRAVEEVCENYDIVPYRMYNYSYLTDSKGKKVIYIDVEPSKALDELRWELAKKLERIIDLKSFQRNRSFKFHITIAFKDIDKKFDRIWKYLQNKEKPNIHSHALRITILKNSKILREYDLLQKKMLNRSEAKSKIIYQQTIEILKKNNFYQDGIINKIKNLFSKRNVFITSDHHFYHNNIIEYCNRPYSSVFEMNEDMIYRWNKVVSKNDRVYHLGDLALAGKKDEYFKKIKNLRTRLNGDIIIIIGNHDEKGGRPKLLRKAGFKVMNKDYVIIKNLILSHRPLKNISNGYVNVHGHIHDKKTIGKRINASVDVTCFEPKHLDYFLKKAKIILKSNK